MENKCIYCGKQFEQNKSGRKKKYCSKRCCDRKKHKVILSGKEHEDKYNCKVCGKEFESYNKKAFCSKSCSKVYFAKLSKEKRKSGEYKTIRKIFTKECVECKRTFNTKVKKTIYCSCECAAKKRPQNQRKNFNEYRGKDHLLDWNYKDWRKKVFVKDGFTCKSCGYAGGKTLVAHHLNGWHENIELRYEVNNGITVCNDCHIMFHNKYGYGKNTLAQFKEFLEVIVNGQERKTS